MLNQRAMPTAGFRKNVEDPMEVRVELRDPGMVVGCELRHDGSGAGHVERDQGTDCVVQDGTKGWF